MSKNLKNLPYPDNKHFDAAEGWLELGNWQEANEELEHITPRFKSHPYVLELRYKIYQAAGRPEKAVEAAGELRTLLPENPLSHIHLAFSLHELKRTTEAYDILISVVDQFPAEGLMRYNLACYACQLGNHQESMAWLEQAIKLAGKKAVYLMALEDPDLEPLRPKIKEL
jgi:predicted Zn-dependent protease